MLISDLSGVQAVHLLFAGATEDTHTIISDLSGVEARRHTLFQVAQWTPRRINRDDRIQRGAWRSDFVWRRGTAAYSISGGAVDTETHGLEGRGGQLEAGNINLTMEQEATETDRGKDVDAF